MESTAVMVVMIVIGVPILGGIAGGVINSMIKAKIKLRELDVQEQKIRLEDKLRTDELNAKILQMDDLGMSAGDIATLSEQVRQLREEITRLKQDINNRSLG